MKIGIIDSGIDSYFIYKNRIVIKKYADFYIGDESDNYSVVSKRYDANDLAEWYLYPNTNNFMTDSNGHGTKVLEIISNEYNNGEFIIAKVLNENIRTNSASLIKAFEWIIDEKPRILNMSPGLLSENGKKELYDLTLKALSNNIVICCAAHHKKSFPAMFDTVMTICNSDFLEKHNDLTRDITGNINVMIDNKVTEKSSLFKKTSYACAYFSGYLANKLDRDKNLKKKRNDNIKYKIDEIKNMQFEKRTPLSKKKDKNYLPRSIIKQKRISKLNE